MECRGIVAVLLVSYTASVTYSGYHVFSATPQGQHQVDDLRQFLTSGMQQGNIDVWSSPRESGKAVKFMVPGSRSAEVEAWLTSNSIGHRVETTDVQSEVDEAAIREAASKAASRLGHNGLNLTVYNDHHDINAFLHQTVADCDICRLIHIGPSYENRDMIVIKIGSWRGRSKQGIWIDAGIHAREWIAPATSLNIINKLVTGHKEGDEAVQWLLEHYVFFILPSANPDGYTYSRTTERFWRKTRRPTRTPDCIGTDPNRNWNFHWAEAGVSFNPCSEIFPGGAPFTEAETRNIRDFLLGRHNFIIYVSLHSYGQYWLYPWGYDSSLPPDWEDLHYVGWRALRKIRQVSGSNYTLGSSTNVLYVAAGTSCDWAKGVGNIKYSYTVELPDDGDHGFLLPPDQIEPTFHEIWPALVEMVRAVHGQEFNGVRT